jgi:hypothetical protein
MAVCAAVSGAAHANDKVTFRDVLKPHGHARSSSEKLADGVACGTTADAAHTLTTILPVFEKCMRGKGWALARYTPDPASRPSSGSLEVYTDTKGDGSAHPRDDAALHADTRACERGGKASVNRCLAGRGWRFQYARYAPPAPRVKAQPQWGWSSGPPSSSSTERDDDIRRTDEFNRMMQEQSDQMVATQNAVNAQQAQDQIMQNAINNMVVNPQ